MPINQPNRLASPCPVLATLGDSRPAGGFTSASGFLNKVPVGAASWIEPISGGRVSLPSANNCAVSGAKFSDVLATQLPNLLALTNRPTHAIILAGTNDIAGGVAQVMIKTNILAIWEVLRAARIQAVQICDLPRTNASWSTANQQASQELNAWMRTYGPANGAVIIDPAPLIADPANSNGDPLTGYYQSDGIHPAARAAYQVGLALWQQYFSLLPLAGYSRPATLADAYNSTNNPRGNLLPSAGLFTGTGGSSNGTGASGTVATGWQNRVISGTMTAVAVSPAARADIGGAGNWQEIGISVTSAGVYRLEPSATITGQSAGDTVVGEIDLSWTGAANMLYCQLNVFDIGGASGNGAIAFKNPGLSTLYLPASSGGTIRLITDPFVITTGNTGIAFRTEAGFDNSGTCTLKAGQASLRKVIAQ